MPFPVQYRLPSLNDHVNIKDAHDQMVLLDSQLRIKEFLKKSSVEHVIPQLCIEVAGGEWNKDSSEDIASVIECVTGLEHLKLAFLDIHHFTRSKLKRITEALSKVNKLKKFTLALDRSKLSKPEIQEFAIIVESQVELEHFTFSICK